MYDHIFGESPEERAQRYRQLALAAEANADRETLPAIRASYLRSAERWNKLASLMELGIGNETRKSAKSDTFTPPKKARGWVIHKQQNELQGSLARCDSADSQQAQDEKQGEAGVAVGSGTGVRRSVLERRGILGRPSPVRVSRLRSA